MVACLIPGRFFPEDPSAGSLIEIPHLDKAVHFGMFFLFALLWLRAGTGSGRSGRVLACGIGLAAATEVAQGLPFVERDPEVLDALADAAGVISGLYVGRMIALRNVIPKSVSADD